MTKKVPPGENPPPSSIKIWHDMLVTWTFTNEVYGSYPASKEILPIVIRKRINDGVIRPVSHIELGPEGRQEIHAEGVSMSELYQRKLEEGLAMLPTEEEMIEERSLVFRRRNGQFFVPGGDVRSHIKDLARTLSSLLLPKKVEGAKSLNVRAVSCLYVREDEVVFMRNGEPVTQADGVDEFFVHVRHPQTGTPMSSIKRVEALSPGVSLMFTLAILGDLVTEEELNMIFAYGSLHGFGQERSRGFGRYTFEFVPV